MDLFRLKNGKTRVKHVVKHFRAIMGNIGKYQEPLVLFHLIFRNY